MPTNFHWLVCMRNKTKQNKTERISMLPPNKYKYKMYVCDWTCIVNYSNLWNFCNRKNANAFFCTHYYVSFSFYCYKQDGIAILNCGAFTAIILIEVSKHSKKMQTTWKTCSMLLFFSKKMKIMKDFKQRSSNNNLLLWCRK